MSAFDAAAAAALLERIDAHDRTPWPPVCDACKGVSKGIPKGSTGYCEVCDGRGRPLISSDFGRAGAGLEAASAKTVRDELMLHLRAAVADNVRMFPVLSVHGKPNTPNPLKIPWTLAEEAYSAYAARYGKGQSLETLATRGGFAPDELDILRPGWREAASEILRLKEQLTKLYSALEVLHLRGCHADTTPTMAHEWDIARWYQYLSNMDAAVRDVARRALLGVDIPEAVSDREHLRGQLSAARKEIELHATLSPNDVMISALRWYAAEIVWNKIQRDTRATDAVCDHGDLARKTLTTLGLAIDGPPPTQGPSSTAIRYIMRFRDQRNFGLDELKWLEKELVHDEACPAMTPERVEAGEKCSCSLASILPRLHASIERLEKADEPTT